ncbi:hypothetical protein [Flavobacterium palustre]|uniref:hypothetical protein n=1 Tax=Flavobacterium palustre TaxID=1476463 RepID=UPI00360C852B
MNAAGMFDWAKFKEYFKANPAQAEFLKQREKDAELNAKYQIYSSLIQAASYTTKAEGKLKYKWKLIRLLLLCWSIVFFNQGQ